MKMEMIDDILAPRDTMLVKFQGKNPFVPVQMATGLLREILKISAKDILETEVKWDNSSEMRNFYGKWMGKRHEDQWTDTWIRIVIQGEQHAKERTGWCNIEIKGTIRTKYNMGNFLQRMFWWFYNHTFYYKQRRMYAEQGKDMIYEIRDKYMSALGIAPKE